jgi:hypothetical protein
MVMATVRDRFKYCISFKARLMFRIVFASVRVNVSARARVRFRVMAWSRSSAREVIGLEKVL